MKKELTLHQKFLRMKAEELLEQMGTPIGLPDFEDEIVEEREEGSPTLSELELEAQKTVDAAEQFFAKFGLVPEKQEELFHMPIIRHCQDEIVGTVMREREELERTIGRPRNGWDLLPFEKTMETEKMLKNLPEHIESKKVREIHLDEIFDRSAEDQIVAVQRRLSAALEDVKEAANRQRKAMRLPILPKGESLPSIGVKPLLELPDLREKRKIDANCERHYSEQLKIVLPEKDALERAIVAGNFSSKGEETQSTHSDPFNVNLGTPSDPKNEGENLSTGGEVRALEAISEDIEKMTSRREKVAEVIAVEVSPVLGNDQSAATIACEDVQPMGRKLPALRPNGGIVISALKSKVQRENSGRSELLEKDLEPGKAHEKALISDLFRGVTLPQLPVSRRISDETGPAENKENDEKVAAAHRRPMGPRRFCL
ncbi:MAG: hypothetical protein LBI77_01915 [Puniceicoccales bacterium]|jgi:hypothetical protein|nr:hypothetical protein [Puniceicoccales bacterium]